MLRIDNFDNQEKEISIIVSPLYRNCGIGTKLLDFYFSRANNNSLTNYFAWIHVNNFGSIKLFTKFGFKIVSSENDFYLLFKDPIL